MSTLSLMAVSMILSHGVITPISITLFKLLKNKFTLKYEYKELKLIDFFQIPVIVATKYNTNDIFPDVMNIAFYCRH
jgi:hypothetical protein